MEDFGSGIERFIIGIGKKAIIANTMAATADAIWNNYATGSSWIIVWIGSIAYTLQIYYDFSGYSDMAIGLGRMLGFHFNENFNLPYISKSITEFWRRWHISLSSWFRDYVYIPLGGNKRHVYFNLLIVFLLTGIWHGASWHYVAWGVWNGAFILIERKLKLDKKRDYQKYGMLGRGISKIYTLFIVNIGWVIFRAPHTSDAFNYIATMFGVIRPESVGYTVLWYLDRWTITIMVIGVLFASAVPMRIKEIIKAKISKDILCVIKYILLLVLFYLSLLRIVSGTYNPFIYFQF